MGYRFKRNKGQEVYVRERVKKAMGIMENRKEKIWRELEKKNGVV